MGFYPIFLELTGRPCLAIGGGSVAERKVEGLLAAEASVTVVSPTLTPGLEALAQAGRIRHVKRGYEPGDLESYRLAFVATDDRAVNAHVAAEGRERGVWVNAADDPANCDFILPSVVHRGGLMIAVATGGSSPALSRLIREELEDYFTDDYALLAEIAGEVRRELRGRGVSPSADAWRGALDRDLRRLIREGRQEEARARLFLRLRAGICA
jgi:precorrin-2 dehydrogenase/sirohydrochlorin ferrochelatase